LTVEDVQVIAPHLIIHQDIMPNVMVKADYDLLNLVIQNFIDTAVNMVRENLGISDDILNILSFNTQQYSMDIQRLRSTIEKFKNETNYVKNTIDKMNIPGLEKDYKYVEKRYDWAKLRCEQLERNLSMRSMNFLKS
jgi:hypothetical protein